MTCDWREILVMGFGLIAFLLIVLLQAGFNVDGFIVGRVSVNSFYQVGMIFISGPFLQARLGTFHEEQDAWAAGWVGC